MGLHDFHEIRCSLLIIIIRSQQQQAKYSTQRTTRIHGNVYQNINTYIEHISLSVTRYPEVVQITK